MKRICEFQGCGQPSARSGFFGELLRQYGLQYPGVRFFASVMDSACPYHARMMARHTAERHGIETRLQDPEPPSRAGEPARHYPAGPGDRRRRLAEIEADMARPARKPKALQDEREALSMPQDRLAGAKSNSARAKDRRALLFEYLRQEGVDPTRVGNW